MAPLAPLGTLQPKPSSMPHAQLIAFRIQSKLLQALRLSMPLIASRTLPGCSHKWNALALALVSVQNYSRSFLD